MRGRPARCALLALLLLAALPACDLAEDVPAPQLVVEAVLIADQPLPRVRLSQTAPLDAPYDPDAQAVLNAAVTVTEVETGTTFAYQDDPSVLGAYLPADPLAQVQPGRRYRLEVRPPDALGLLPVGQTATAETLVPGRFQVVRPPPPSLPYDPFGPPPSLDVTPSAYPGRQAVYLFTITARQPTRDNLTPTYASFDPEDVDNLATGSSPLLNEQNYERNPDGTLRLRIPWLAIAFYGENEFIAHALDDALFDFIRSRDAQFSPTTLSPGEIPEVLSNVRGALGVFGSAARQSVRVTIERNPAFGGL